MKARSPVTYVVGRERDERRRDFPGDLISTGTPDGVGSVKPGDVTTLGSEPPPGTLEIAIRARASGA
jgi:hypothetical protein